MWKRETFHDYADELSSISSSFIKAYLNIYNYDEVTKTSILHQESKKGIDLLKAMALSIRSEQDYNLTANIPDVVGSFSPSITQSQINHIFNSYTPPFSSLGFNQLKLRDALNKIAHANPRGSSFFANETVHDLLLSGTNHGQLWLAIISIPTLCSVIKRIPDFSLLNEQ